MSSCLGRQEGTATLSWSNLTVTVTDVKGNDRHILKGVDGYVEPNHMMVGGGAQRHAPRARWSIAAEALTVVRPCANLPRCLCVGHHGPQRLRQNYAARHSRVIFFCLCCCLASAEAGDRPCLLECAS